MEVFSKKIATLDTKNKWKCRDFLIEMSLRIFAMIKR